MRGTRVIIALSLVAAAVAMPAGSAQAAPASGSCHGSGNVVHVGEATVFMGSPDCDTVVTCSKKRAAGCTLEMEASVMGTGLVALELSAGDSAVGECSGQMSCTTGGTHRMARGSTTIVVCEFGEGAAADISIDCSWALK